jgi:hypothetical protein
MSAPERTNDRANPFTFLPASAISRRALVKASLGAVAAPAVLHVIAVNAQSRVIKIGHVSPRPVRWLASARPTASSSNR